VLGTRADLADPVAAAELLERYGVPLVAQRVVGTPEEAPDAGAELGFPVVLKAYARELVHKSEAGAVRLGLSTRDEVLVAGRELAAALAPEAFVVQATHPGGVELLVGATRDPAFGPVVAVGLGGVFAELLQDVSLRLAPVTPAEARRMLRGLRASPLLDGYRGSPPVDLDAVVDVVVRIGELVAAEPTVAELDLNPVFAAPEGACAVDVRVLLGEPVAATDPASPVPELHALLEPRSIAVVGASADATKPGGLLFRYLVKHGYAGALYPVNPGAVEILGHRCYASVAELPEAPDLACVVVPAAAVAETLAGCGDRGTRAAVVFTAGFAESGADGEERQRELVATARAAGIRLCGPNTAGVVNAHEGICATTGMAFESDELPLGGIAFLTQSGAIGSCLVSRSWAQGLGVGAWVSAGNEADLTISDYLLHYAEDARTSVIALFVETIRDPATFVAACRLARTNGKPIVVYKTGVSEIGRRAVESHTGALAGDARVYDAVFRSLGVIQVDDLQSLMDVSMALDWQPLPAGPRVGVVSGSGGACSVVADELGRLGLELPPLSEALVEAVADVIPAFGTAQNPVDVTAQITRRPEMVGQVARLVLESGEVDSLLVALTTNADPPAAVVAEGVVEAARASGKPLLVCRLGAEFLAPRALARYREARVPVFPMPDRTARALKAMIDHHAGMAAEEHA
jgi:acyl-CoA synthetase (NDP forming)